MIMMADVDLGELTNADFAGP